MQVACRIKTLTEFFGKLGFRRSMWDLLVRARKVDGALVILNVSIDNVLVRTNSHILRTKVINHLKSYFPLRQKEGTAIKHLNCRTIQSKIHIPMDQTYHIMKMTTACFKTVKYLSTDTPFLTDHNVKSEIANVTPNKPGQHSTLQVNYGEFSSNFGAALCTMVSTRLDIGHSMKSIGCFQKVLQELGCLLMCRLLCYLITHHINL